MKQSPKALKVDQQLQLLLFPTLVDRSNGKIKHRLALSL